jgi:YD repeat-containing protein
VRADYVYDALERLALRTTQNMTPSGTTHYVYDRAGHLLAEASDTGTTIREYVWLDDMPLVVVADVDTATPLLWTVHADHLDRPIKMTDQPTTVVWGAVSAANEWRKNRALAPAPGLLDHPLSR